MCRGGERGKRFSNLAIQVSFLFFKKNQNNQERKSGPKKNRQIELQFSERTQSPGTKAQAQRRDGVTNATLGTRDLKSLTRTVIGIASEIEGAAVVFYTLIGTDRQTAHAFSLIIIHTDVAKWDQPGISVK